MDWSSDLCIRSIKRPRSSDYPSDQLSKVSRLSFPSLLSSTHLLNHETPRTAYSDSSHFTPQTGTCNDVHPQPEVISKPIHSNVNIPHLNHKMPDAAVQEIEKISVNIMNLTDSPTVAQKSKQIPDKFNTSGTLTSKQTIHNTSNLKSNDRGCPDCAAGQSGHIRHIGRWRLMDSF